MSPAFLVLAVALAAASGAPSRSDDVASPQVGPAAGRASPDIQQVGRASRDAAPPTPLSTPAEGRDVRLERVTGQDRCDPAVAGQRPEICEHAIETRAGDFAPAAPAPVSIPSPETRLLRAGEPVADADRTARQLAAGGAPSSDVAQAVASGILNPAPVQAPEPAPAAPTVDPVVSAVLKALANGANGPVTVTTRP